MYPVSTSYGTVLIGDHKMIIRHYLKGWFIIDLVSVAPFDFLGLLLDSSEMSELKVLRVIRLLRLLKLARLFRGLRILKRWAQDFAFSYRKLTLWQLLVAVIVTAHWISCVFGIVNNLEGDTCLGPNNPSGCVWTWLSDPASEIHARGEPVTALQIYSIALYASATIIVHPHDFKAQNEVERLCFVVLIFLGGFCWTRVISKSTAIATSMDYHNIHYHQTMDDLNHIAADLGLNAHLKKRLRAYFMNTKNSSIKATWKSLMERMSPSLRNEVAYQVNKAWLRKVPYLAKASRLLMRDVTMNLSALLVAQQETFGENFALYILNKGICSWSKHDKYVVITPGNCWGEEHLFLKNWELLLPNTATSATFCELTFITAGKFQEVVEDHPSYHTTYKKFYLLYAFIRTMIHAAWEERKKAKEQTSMKLRKSSASLTMNLDRRPSKDSHHSHDMDRDHHRDQAERAKRNMRKSLTAQSGLSPLAANPIDRTTFSSGGLQQPQPAATEESLMELERRVNARIDQKIDAHSAKMEALMKAELADLKKLMLEQFQKNPVSTMRNGHARDLGNGCGGWALPAH